LDADILKQRAKIAGLTFDDLMQADFFMSMREATDALKADQHNRWMPRGADPPRDGETVMGSETPSNPERGGANAEHLSRRPF
jgi:hypothetical protein